MSYHYHQKIPLANKCEIGTDFSLQLLLLIYPAILSNVHPILPFKLWKQSFALKDSTKKLDKPSPTCVHLFYYIWLKRVFLCSAPAWGWIKCLYSAWRRATSNQIPSVTVTWQETEQPDTRRGEDGEGEETLAASLLDITNPAGRS